MRTAGQLVPPPPPLLHATRPPPKVANDNTRPSIDRHPLLRLGITKRNKLARTTPPRAYHGPPRGMEFEEVQAFEVLAVVAIVRVPVPAAPGEIARGLLELKLKVGGSEAPAGLLVIAGVRVTLPVNPPIEVTVIVEVFPVAAPAEMLTGVPLTVNSGDAGW